MIRSSTFRDRRCAGQHTGGAEEDFQFDIVAIRDRAGILSTWNLNKATGPRCISTRYEECLDEVSSLCRSCSPLWKPMAAFLGLAMDQFIEADDMLGKRAASPICRLSVAQCDAKREASPWLNCSWSSRSSAFWLHFSCRPFKQRESARRASCINKLKNLATACLTYESAKKKLPPGRKFNYWDTYTWTEFILPHIEEQSVYDNYWTISDPTLVTPGTAPSANGPIGDDDSPAPSTPYADTRLLLSER